MTTNAYFWDLPFGGELAIERWATARRWRFERDTRPGIGTDRILDWGGWRIIVSFPDRGAAKA